MTLNDGVAIGTAAVPMLHSGVRVHLVKETGTAAHTVTSAARIHATIDGIYQSNSGLGANTLTNTGDINAGRYGLFLNMGSATATGAASITNEGAIMVTGADANGIRLARTGTGNASITNEGAITASGAGSLGVFANTAFSTTTAGDMMFENSGAITASGSGSTGVLLRHAGADATIVNNGAVTSGGRGIVLTHTGTGMSGAISVSNTARIAAGMTGTTLRHGISVSRAASSGTVSVTNSGDITTNGHGIHVDAAGSGDVSVTNSGDIKGGGYGLFVRGEVAAGTVSVTHSAGEISGGLNQGIFAHVGRWRSEYPVYSGLEFGAPPPAPTSTADLKVIVTGGTVRTLDTYGERPGGRTAIAAWNYENGSVEVDVRQGVELRSVSNVAIDATLSDEQNTRGRIKITQAGRVTSRGALRAFVNRGSASGETRAASAQPLIDIAWTGTFTSSDPMIRPTSGVSHAIERAHARSALSIFRGARPPPGIEAEVVSWQRMNWTVSVGDDPGEIADAAAQAALLDTAATNAATKARAAAIIAQLRSVLTDDTLGTIPGAAAIDANNDRSYSDAELMAYLRVDTDARRTLLRNVLRHALSDEEKAVLRAVARRSAIDVNTALGDADAGFSDAYKAAVRALLDERNVGDIRVAVNGGSIAAAWPEATASAPITRCPTAGTAPST